MNARQLAASLVVCLALAAADSPAQIVFDAPVPFEGGGVAQHAHVGDLNEDGWPDAVVDHFVFFGAGLTISFGEGGGALGPWQSIPTAPGMDAIDAIADFDADGHLDLLVHDNGGQAVGSVKVLFGDGTGAFPTNASLNTTQGSPRRAAVGDFDGDGTLDVVISNGFIGFSVGSLLVVMGEGGGSFDTPQQIPNMPSPDFTQGGTVHCGDLDGDGLDDIVFRGNSGVSLLSQGDGSFAPSCPGGGCFLPGGADLVLADVNGDGRDDAVTSVQVYPTNAQGNFTLGQVLAVTGFPTAVDVGDLDGDGELDVVIGRNIVSELLNPGQTVGDVLVLRGNGDGTFQTPGLVVSKVPQPRDVEIADMDADGRPDVLAANFQSLALRVLPNRTYGPGSPFLDLGGALGGTNGYPIQIASGTLVAGQPFSFRLASGPPSGQAWHIVGLAALNAPFKGGTLIPAATLVNGPFPLDGTGGLNLAGNWPSGGSGLTLWAQFWMAQGGSPAGFAATSGVRAQIP